MADNIDHLLEINPKHRPELDPEFLPAFLWNQAYQAKAESHPQSFPIAVALQRIADGTCCIYNTKVLPHEGEYIALNEKYIERLVKFLLWQRRGRKIIIGGYQPMVEMIRSLYSPIGKRHKDYELIGEKVYDGELQVEGCSLDDLPADSVSSFPLGRHLDGCRIGFDLGGSDRKAAAVIDGEAIFSEEISWDPRMQTDPAYHQEGIRDSLRRAAEHLPKDANGRPRIDAIGGSAAGIYIDKEVKIASLFRSVRQEAFDAKVRRIFFDVIENEWGNVPFEVVNDGEVTALAGSMSLNDNAVLGVAMGTSLAAGYVNATGHITPWLNELAFAPIDYREKAPVDEWSGDRGCGVDYLSQQGVGRLTKPAGFDFDADSLNSKNSEKLAQVLEEVQSHLSKGDQRARKIYESLGVYFGYSIAHYAQFYDIHNLLVLGRVTSGEGGAIIINKAQQVLRDECSELCDQIKITTPDEKDKRHGQAIAAASLPELSKK